jgi:hypothetical protein
MNNRIKELAEQAVAETQLPMIMEYKNFESKLYEKFAELIVKDCVTAICNDAKKFPLGDLTWICAMEESARVITKHFGI